MATYKGYEFPDDATIAEMEAMVAQMDANPEFLEPPKSDEPDYGSMGPLELATEAAYNAPESTYRLAGDLYTAVTNPIDTLDAVTKLGAGALQLMLPDELVDMVGRDQESIDMARNVGKFYADRYGSVEAAKKAIATDPAGVLADLATVITGGGSAVRSAGSLTKMAPTGAPGKAIGSAVERAGSAIQSAGGAIEPLTATVKGASSVVKGAAPVVGNVVAQTLGRTTGVGETPIEEAYKAGRAGGAKQEALTKSMSGELDFDAALTEANNVMQKMKDDRAAQYQQNMAGIDTVPEVIDYGVVQSSIDAARKRVSRTGVTDPNNMAMNVLDKAESLVDRFKQGGFNSPLDADDLKRQLWQLEESIADVSKTKNETARNALKDVRNAVKAEIELAAPQYHKAMKDFSEASDIIDEISVDLKLGDKKKASQALKRLQSAMRNNVYTGYGHRLKNVQRLEDVGGETIMPMLAGQALNDVMPRGIPVAGVGTTAGGYTLGGVPGLITGAGMSSPKLMGTLAKTAGQTARYADKATQIPRGLLQAVGQPELINLMQQAELQRQRGLLQ